MNESHPPGYASSMLALAALLLTNAILGPIGVGLLDYPLPTSLFNQLVGLELVTVFLVVPTLAAAAVLARRGHPAAALLGIGPCGYAAYMFVQYVVGPDRTSYSPAVLIHLAGVHGRYGAQCVELVAGPRDGVASTRRASTAPMGIPPARACRVRAPALPPTLRRVGDWGGDPT